MNLLHGRSQTKTDLYVSGNPGKLIEVSQDGQGVRTGKSSFGVVKQVRLEYTSEVNAGDYVLLRVGLLSAKSTKKRLLEPTNYWQKWISYPSLKFHRLEPRFPKIQERDAMKYIDEKNGTSRISE